MNASTPRPLVAPWKITLMAAAGTLLPALIVALAFAFTPLPVTPAAAEVLRTLVRMAGLFVGLNAAVVVAVTLANALSVRRPRRGRDTLVAARR